MNKQQSITNKQQANDKQQTLSIKHLTSNNLTAIIKQQTANT